MYEANKKDEDSTKICVVTGFKGGNYGTKLQSTALCKYFEKQGCQTYILQDFKVFPYFLRHPCLLWNRIRHRFEKKKRRQFFEPDSYAIASSRMKRLANYEESNYRIMSLRDMSTWKSVVEENYIFVVGSDIIWQPSFGLPGYWFLDFAYYTKLRKFSYATSIGANVLPAKYNHLYRKYLGAFNAVSVREKSAAGLLQSATGLEIETVVDPTLLHDTDFWDTYAGKAEIPHHIKAGKYILCYFVMSDSRYWDYMKVVRQESKMEIVVLPMHKRDEDTGYSTIMNGTPYEFIWLIKNAAFICTDSFHACAFSLNYSKEFYLLRRKRRDEDSKYDDFLTQYGLEDRCITDESKFVRMPEIDYKKAHLQLAQDRQRAYEYLSQILR